MKKITFNKAIENLNEYINNTDFDIEYLEIIYNYLLNESVTITE